jgi:hypothetical protein
MPVCRGLDDGKTMEVLHVATDATANACSFLYSFCARIARLIGYKRVITYTLASEAGASLRAVGAKLTGPLLSHEWGNPNHPRKSQSVYHDQKYRWERDQLTAATRYQIKTLTPARCRGFVLAARQVLTRVVAVLRLVHMAPAGLVVH